MQLFWKKPEKIWENFIEIINNVVKITEILEKQYVIIPRNFRIYYSVIGMGKCLKILENFIQFLEKF